MTDFYWELPTRGDGRRVATELGTRGGFGVGTAHSVATDLRPGRFGPFDELAQVIHAAELSGVDGVVAGYDPSGEESWIVAAAALRQTRHARVAVEFHPAFGTPVYASKMSATLQRLSGGRLEWRLAVETDPADARSRGDRVTGRDRYARAAEFLTVARGVWNDEEILPGGFGGTGYEFAGDYYDVIDGGFRGILSGLPFPVVHLTGDSEDALALSARHGDVHQFALTESGFEGPARTLAALAREHGRSVRTLLRVPVIARETSGEAWARVERLWREVHPGPGIDDPRALDRGESRWAGFDRLGHPQSIGLVGSYEDVARQLSSLRERGADGFVLLGRPHIEELHRAGEHLLHLVDPAGRTLATQEAHS
ncbi:MULTISPECIES: LLM class flavin-dependent oxidoreductase [Rhodococcus]|uniref:LLM class flavin-dependent oxidoreductase n=1 Tax=Rhodococcus jostii TaxID=132919 RepID=A0ABU4CEW5_RHOJO|nr:MULTISPECIES: LLM class flavin-dependent oxidoreductase [Rhodococcus]MDI9978139.1 LLM class flavin-dependent oxidoreductase [Rhodococcus sp. IEGM 1307]MDV6282103.1 LLM class flavin-dependent oxidoreductase [Rhodococcus jostii]